MKTMTCKQLGGACGQEFQGDTFDDIVTQSKRHGMEMFQKGDPPHLQAMKDLQQSMRIPDAMSQWMESKRKEFDALPDD